MGIWLVGWVELLARPNNLDHAGMLGLAKALDPTYRVTIIAWVFWSTRGV